MKALALTVTTVFLACASANAGEKVTFEEAKKIQAALNAIDCFGGEMEKESNGSATFEIDDVVCSDGQFDFKLDEKFSLVAKDKS